MKEILVYGKGTQRIENSIVSSKGYVQLFLQEAQAEAASPSGAWDRGEGEASDHPA